MALVLAAETCKGFSVGKSQVTVRSFESLEVRPVIRREHHRIFGGSRWSPTISTTLPTNWPKASATSAQLQVLVVARLGPGRGASCNPIPPLLVSEADTPFADRRGSHALGPGDLNRIMTFGSGQNNSSRSASRRSVLPARTHPCKRRAVLRRPAESGRAFAHVSSCHRSFFNATKCLETGFPHSGVRLSFPIGICMRTVFIVE